jgi:hypothetical protein
MEFIFHSVFESEKKLILINSPSFRASEKIGLASK